MLEIDGSYGEGGGQIIRTAVAFSVLTGEPIRVFNIRAKRPSPGLKAQHKTAIECLSKICNGECKGLDEGSSEIVFKPGRIQTGSYEFNTGTAGSITLIFQACILALHQTHDPITIRIKGGSDVPWSPSFDYFKKVFLKLISNMNIHVDAILHKRGYYPKGGGEASIIIHPYKGIKPLQLKDKQQFKHADGVIHISRLHSDIGRRMKHSAIQHLLKHNLTSSIHIEESTADSEGTGITLYTISNGSVLGSSMLGEKGLRAEKVGEKAAINLCCEIESGATIDVYGFDQILPYMALSSNIGSSSVIVRDVSSHAETNIWLIKNFLEVSCDIYKYENRYLINIHR
ncbi:MAG: RNA 3'-terminal phosphate cyclase [Candidatus Thermoplasmatota archaeon]